MDSEFDLNDEWASFMNSSNATEKVVNVNDDDEIGFVSKYENTTPPDPTPIYISTKSKISYLNVPVNLQIFWDIPVISYSTAKEGCIKKQTRVTSLTLEDYEHIQSKLVNELYVEQFIVCHINNPDGRIKFKDIRKISIGIYKKDLTNKTKNKEAFYNCVVLIMRFKINNLFREFHIKLFNTGKIEIPGIKNDDMYQEVLDKLVAFIQPYYTLTSPTVTSSFPIFCKPTNDIVLINSNFNCGFYINREKLIKILKKKYHIISIYDPCHYPGVKMPFYYDVNLKTQNGIQTRPDDKKCKDIVKIHCSIFRTGSVLILGTCNEFVLNQVYTFVANLLKTEFKYICSDLITELNKPKSNKNKKRKSQKKYIIYNDVIQCDDDDCANTLTVDAPAIEEDEVTIIDDDKDEDEEEEYDFTIVGK